MQCDHGPTVFNARLFVRDFCRELRNLTQPERPAYPEKSWWAALRYADERDQIRFISRLNGASDGDGNADYFARQHLSDLRVGDSSSAQAPALPPQVDTCRPRPSKSAQMYERYGRYRPRQTRQSGIAATTAD